MMTHGGPDGAWGNHTDHILANIQFQTFGRDKLQRTILEVCSPNPERLNPESNEDLVKYIKEKVTANGLRVILESLYEND